jgi:hypothetical protein
VSRHVLGHTQPSVKWVPGFLSPELKRSVHELTTHFHIMSRLRTRVAIPPLPILMWAYPKVSGRSPGAIIANGTALCHKVQLYRYFVSQSSEFCRHNPLCCFSTSVCCCLFRYRLSPETSGYTLVLCIYMCLCLYFCVLSCGDRGHWYVEPCPQNPTVLSSMHKKFWCVSALLL